MLRMRLAYITKTKSNFFEEIYFTKIVALIFNYSDMQRFFFFNFLII